MSVSKSSVGDVECLANINQYIVAKVGTRRYKDAQLFRMMFAAALFAGQNELTRIKLSNV